MRLFILMLLLANAATQAMAYGPGKIYSAEEKTEMAAVVCDAEVIYITERPPVKSYAIVRVLKSYKGIFPNGSLVAFETVQSLRVGAKYKLWIHFSPEKQRLFIYHDQYVEPLRKK